MKYYSEYYFLRAKHVDWPASEATSTKGEERRMVRLAGVEPATNGFEVRYSIQLSYRRIKLEISDDDYIFTIKILKYPAKTSIQCIFSSLIISSI